MKNRKPPRDRHVSAHSDSESGQGVTITHPEREVFPGTGITKGDVADYYRKVAPWILPELVNRPLSVVRCPEGIGRECFFQKHVGSGWGENVHGVQIEEKNASGVYLCIADANGLLELVQMNVLELHVWGTKSTNLEHADRLVFDLDPHEGVEWREIRYGARAVRKYLDAKGLQSFVRTSGGKGLHVVVPLAPPAPWETARVFAKSVASTLSGKYPERFVDVAGKKHRANRIFIDWLRNGRGATSIASYSLRARAAVGVAMPLAWDELGRVGSADAYTIRNTRRRLASLRSDPWHDITSIRQHLSR